MPQTRSTVDELTRERYPHGVPWREKRRRVWPTPDAATVRERRMVLCGTADLAEQVQGLSTQWRARDSRLVEAIRRYSP